MPLGRALLPSLLLLSVVWSSASSCRVQPRFAPLPLLRGGGAPDHDAASALGTQEHWRETYTRQLGNLAETGDPGEEWFEEENHCVERIVSWIADQLCAGEVASRRVLDVGCGNGGMLVQLGQAGFLRLTGADYVEQALELAKANLVRELAGGGQLSGGSAVAWEVVLDNVLESQLAEGSFDLIHDKGTLDAILLSCSGPEAQASVATRYSKAVERLARTGGLLVVTSCNLSEAELISAISAQSSWEFRDSLRYPTLSFGGSEGSRIASVAFIKSGPPL